MSEKRVIRNADDLRGWCSRLYTLPFPFRVAALPGSDRTLDQNALSWKWYSEVGYQMGESPDEVHARAKLDIGCPILCRDDPVFNGFFHHAVAKLTREQQLKSMKFLSVTSDMTVRQMSEFMDTFERQHRAQGLTLTTPEAI